MFWPESWYTYVKNVGVIGHNFLLRKVKSLNFLKYLKPVDLSAQYKFQLNTFCRFQEIWFWLAGGQQIGSDPIRVPFLYSTERNPKRVFFYRKSRVIFLVISKEKKN